MRKKLMRVLSVLMIGGLLGVTTVSKASADTLFNIITRAAQTMSTQQIEMQHIAERINIKTQQQIPVVVQKPALTVFGVYSYIEHGKVHNDTNETVHRSNLPLTILTYQEGYGNITGVSIDGIELESALLSKIKINDDDDIDKVCAQAIFLDESLIKNLSDGSHSVIVKCTDTHGTTLIDGFTFNLAN